MKLHSQQSNTNQIATWSRSPLRVLLSLILARFLDIGGTQNICFDTYTCDNASYINLDCFGAGQIVFPAFMLFLRRWLRMNRTEYFIIKLFHFIPNSKVYTNPNVPCVVYLWRLQHPFVHFWLLRSIIFRLFPRRKPQRAWFIGISNRIWFQSTLVGKWFHIFENVIFSYDVNIVQKHLMPVPSGSSELYIPVADRHRIWWNLDLF